LSPRSHVVSKGQLCPARPWLLLGTKDQDHPATLLAMTTPCIPWPRTSHDLSHDSYPDDRLGMRLSRGTHRVQLVRDTAADVRPDSGPLRQYFRQQPHTADLGVTGEAPPAEVSAHPDRTHNHLHGDRHPARPVCRPIQGQLRPQSRGAG